jgi:hypothetical protein
MTNKFPMARESGGGSRNTPAIPKTETLTAQFCKVCGKPIDKTKRHDCGNGAAGKRPKPPKSPDDCVRIKRQSVGI